MYHTHGGEVFDAEPGRTGYFTFWKEFNKYASMCTCNACMKGHYNNNNNMQLDLCSWP